MLYKALARDPQDRYEDMGVFKKALEGLLAGKGSIAPEPVKKSQPTAKPEPKQVVNSEGETWDALEPTPVEISPRKRAVKPAKSKARPEKKLPP